MLDVPKRFRLQRTEDLSGVSGTGVVAQGVDFGGQVVLKWNDKGETPGAVGFYETTEHVLKIHGHDGRTKIEWID